MGKLKISEKGMRYWERIMDRRDYRIRKEWEWNIREGFDWVDENEDNKEGIEGLVKRRKMWLSSKEFEMLSGKMNELEKELRWFRSGLRWLVRKGMVVEGSE